MRQFSSSLSRVKACRLLHLSFLLFSLFCSVDLYVYRVLASNFTSVQTARLSPLASATAIAQPDKNIAQVPATATPQQRRVRVFFPQFPAAENDFTRVAAVERTTSGTSPARTAIAQLLNGPTATEQRRGLRPALRLRGTSNCGPDFTITIRDGVATLQFCRPVISAGVGEDARARSAIEATLRQFSGVRRVVILTSSGNCFGDQSGENRCL